MLLPLASMITILAVISANECPDNCECDHEFRRELANANFSSARCSLLPRSLPTTTTRLTLQNVEVFDVEGLLALVKCTSLSQLVLANCGISDLFGLSRLERLDSLYLSGSRLEHLNGSLNLAGLKTLALPHNEIKLIESGPFRTLSSLKVLNLSANSIETLGISGLDGLANLRTLDLSSNKIAIIHNGMFLSLPKLQYLNLSSNIMEALHEDSLTRLERLQQLDVSQNRLSKVAPGSLELPSLSRLVLSGNAALGTLLVGPGKRLQTLDASRTGLKQVPAALTHSIRTLRLAGNSIQAVSCGDLDSYPLLQLLDLNSNSLEVVEDDALGRLDLLSILYLSDNTMKAIPGNLPENLKVLHLERNRIEHVQAGDLKGLSNLEALLLSDNRIKELGDSAFIQLGALATLDLSRNPISILPAGILSGPWKLQVLRLSNLDVASPAKESSFPLSFPEHLVTLDLSHSPNLARQILADTAALAAARELQELNMEAGDLQLIRSDLIHFLPQLRVLRLKDNPLDCSRLHWLAVWMRRQDQPQHREALCSQPPELSNSLVIDLHDNESDNPVIATETSERPDASTLSWAIKQASAAFGFSPASNNLATPKMPTGTTSNKAAKQTSQKYFTPLTVSTTSEIPTSASPDVITESQVSKAELENGITELSSIIPNESGNIQAEEAVTSKILEVTPASTHIRVEEAVTAKQVVNNISTSTIPNASENIRVQEAVTTKIPANLKEFPQTLVEELAGSTQPKLGNKIPRMSPNKGTKIQVKTNNPITVNKARVPTEKYLSSFLTSASETTVNPQSASLVMQNPQAANGWYTRETDNGEPVSESVFPKKELGEGATVEEAETLPNENTKPVFGEKNVNTEVSKAVTSMFTKSERDRHSVRAGVLVLAIATVLGAVTMTVLTASWCSRHKRRQVERDIEVSSLPSVTELW